MTTLGDLLGTLHRARASGTLELAEDSGRCHRVHLTSGFVVAVEVDGATPTLAEFLRTERRVDNDLLRRSLLRAMSSQRLHGDVLVHDYRTDKGIVDAALRLQLRARLDRLEILQDARVSFRVTVRAPRGAMTDSPLHPSQFLGGKRRARDRSRGQASPESDKPRAHEPPVARRHTAARVLGVSPGADASEIRSAYRRLARAYHPDLHPAASEDERRALSARFQAVTEAYRALVA
jgi:DnaJ-domain-containing protein 1